MIVIVCDRNARGEIVAAHIREMSVHGPDCIGAILAVAHEIGCLPDQMWQATDANGTVVDAGLSSVARADAAGAREAAL